MRAGALALMVHVALLAILYARGRRFGRSLDGALWIVALVVPVFGPLSVLLAEYLISGSVEPDDSIEVARRSETEPPRAPDESAGQIVPLEDALIVNDAPTRRSLMLEVLLRGGEDYVPNLVSARKSSDVEVAHYASSASMEISASYDEALAKGALTFRQHPDDLEAVDSYISVLESYLDSGMATGDLRSIQETSLRAALKRRLELEPDRAAQARLVTCELDAGLFDEADAELRKMERELPDDDEAWLLRLRYWYVLRRPDMIARMIDERDGHPASGRVQDAISFWKKALA